MFEEANIVSIKTLTDELEYKCGVPSNKIKDILENLMKIQIIESIAATKHLLKFYKHTFELVGYDFMLIDGIN